MYAERARDELGSCARVARAEVATLAKPVQPDLAARAVQETLAG